MVTVTSFRSSSRDPIKIHLGMLIVLSLASVLAHGSSIPSSPGTADNDFEFRGLSGEPNYKSVNLTWEIEANIDVNETHHSKFPRIFAVFYCEIQSFGPHRCKSKVLEDNTVDEIDEQIKIKHYSTIIDNLRMSTKYSFHIKPQTKPGEQKMSGRSESRDNEVEPDSKTGGQTIVIPTKGFSAQATRCLPTASEIEVETGPYFGGKIVVDGGNCGIQGDPKDPREKYVMRIDHSKCGSNVKPESNTVETFITVQENLGIFTHSTRRFVVVCTFQSGIQTVRASFTVPGKGGATSWISEDNDFSSSRNGRERQFKMVDKSALVLREPESEEFVDEKDAKVEQSVKEAKVEEKKPSTEAAAVNETTRNVNYARLVDESHSVNEKEALQATTGTSYIGLIIAVSISVTMAGMLGFIIQREVRRRKINYGRGITS